MLRRIFYLAGNFLALVTGVGLLARFVPPSVLWPPAIIALVLPVLLVLTLLFTLLMLYRKRWGVATFPAVVLFFSLSVAGRLFAFGGGETVVDQQDTVIIATNNARGFKNAAWQDVSPEQIARVVKQLDADVLLLQEASSGKSKSGMVKSAGQYAARLQPKNRMVATYANNIKTISTSLKGHNGFTVVDVNTDLGPIRFINTHLQSNRISGLADKLGKDKNVQEGLDRAESMFRSYGKTARIRATQADEIRTYIQDSPHPVVVAGDFNDVATSYTYERILTPRLRDAWTTAGVGLGTTFTGPLPGLRIDFMLVDTNFSILEVERFETGYSDHRGLRVKIGGK